MTLTPPSHPEPAARERTTPLARHLAEHDEPCPSCGYSLRGLTGDRCPECDEELALRVNIAEPKLGGWLLTLVPLIVVGGGCIAFELIVVFFVFWEGPPPRSQLVPAVVYPTSLGLAGTAFAYLLARPSGRRWFRRRERKLRHGLTAAAWGAAALALIGWIVMIRW